MNFLLENMPEEPNISNLGTIGDTIGTEESVPISKVSCFQGLQ